MTGAALVSTALVQAIHCSVSTLILAGLDAHVVVIHISVLLFIVVRPAVGAFECVCIRARAAAFATALIYIATRNTFIGGPFLQEVPGEARSAGIYLI